MAYRDKFIVTITSYRDFRNCFSSQGYLRFVFKDFDSAKEFANKTSEDFKRGAIDLKLKITAKTTGIIIYGAPIVLSAKSQYSGMLCFHNEKINVSAEMVKKQISRLRKERLVKAQ